MRFQPKRSWKCNLNPEEVVKHIWLKEQYPYKLTYDYV